ncbi:MAG: DNA polymerase I [Gammaproteobacteria bacterium]
MKEKLILVDGSGYLYRAYHALPDLSTSSGVPTGAITGVINMLFKLIDDYDPEYFVVVFDAPGGSFRNEIYQEYKAHRSKMPEDLREQIEPLKNIINALNFSTLVIPGVEADDVIGTISKKAESLDLDVLISTSDKDMAQLVTKDIRIINSNTQNLLDEKGVFEKFGVKPNQIIDYLALIGDQSDNIPGVQGVGPKTAQKLLEEFVTLENLLANLDSIEGKKSITEKIKNTLSDLPLFKQLVTIDIKVDLTHKIQDFLRHPPNIDKLLPILDEYELNHIKKRFTNNIKTPAKQFNHNYQMITDEKELNKVIDNIKKTKIFAIDTETTSLNYKDAELVGFSICSDENHAYYVPLAHKSDQRQIDFKTALNLLKGIIENEQITKIGHHIKYDMHVLERYGLKFQGTLFDTMIESFLLDPSLNRHDLNSVSLKYLGINPVTYEEVAGKGAKQICFDEVEVERATQYAAEDAHVTYLLHKILSKKISQDKNLEKIYFKIDEPLIKILQRIESTGVLLDEKKLKQQSQELKKKIKKIEDEVFAEVGEEFNLSSPKQLQRILFEVLELPILGKTPGGQPSTSESVLQDLAVSYELPKKILEHRTVSKLISTYTDKLPLEINSVTNRIHTSYHQANVVTGRLSSSNPNLQNIPIRTNEGRKIREAFIAEENSMIIAADYSQIELRILAHLSQDKNLVRAFNDGLDIHTMTACQIFSLKPKDVGPDERRSAKAINFGIIYGMSPFGLSKQLGIFQNEAKDYIEYYFKQFPDVKNFLEDTKAFARKNKYIETTLGRKIFIDNIDAKNYNLRQYAERAAINAPMQGSAADIIKLAMIELHNHYKNKNQTKMIMQVHDELIFESYRDEAEQEAENIKTTMEQVANLIVPLVVDVGIENNWGLAH